MAPAFRKTLSLFALLTAAVPASASAGAPSFDRSRIRADYRDGEFEKVISGLRGFLKTGRACSLSDSVFLAKHLAVVYAAHPDTRELGRHHMFRLLRMAPDADLLDMFVGQEVDLVFEKVRKEHALSLAEDGKQGSAAIDAGPASGPPVPAGAPPNTSARELPFSPRAPESAWRDPAVWIGGGAALAVVAFTVLFSGSKQPPAAVTYVVPADAR